jgi:hypothetical protein
MVSRHRGMALLDAAVHPTSSFREIAFGCL